MRYVELHCKTNFSFLEGASHADELVVQAGELGYRGLAITDRNSISGIVRAHAAAKEASLPLIVGAEVTLCDALPVLLWAPDRAAYGRLCRLLTVGRRAAEKGEFLLSWEQLAEHSDGLLAGVLPPAPETERGTANLHELDGSNLEQLHRYRELFGDRAYLMLELHREAGDDRRLQQLQTWSRQARLPLLAAGDVQYHVAGRQVLHEVLAAIRQGTTVARLQEARYSNAEHHLRSLEDLAALYAQVPEAVERTIEVADRCQFSLDELRYEYPEELAGPGMTPFEYLAHLSWKGAHKRYPRGIPDKVRRLLQHELSLIEELHYEAYFLTVWDLVRFARRRNILCQGRGSAANSAVCYCLGVTSVDPERTDVLFERFVSRERNEAPDIDVDFEHERREEVLQYLYDKYGRDRAGMTGVVITYRCRSAVRDAGKALGLSLDRVDAVAKSVEGHTHDPQLPERCRLAGIDPDSPIGQRFLYVVQELIGFPRHLSQHVGGMVMTQGPLCELVPIENAAMADRTVIQWDKNDLDELGILKVDCLALGMLTAIHRAFDLIEKHGKRKLTLAGIGGPLADDPQVYDMICRADTVGVFQIESRAQMSMLPRLKPRCYYDLVIEVAIVRPGPIQGQMVHPYLRRRAGLEPVTYPNDEIREVLQKTLGVPLFQEQAMRLAVVAAGFTLGEADQLRRAMGAWRRPGVIDRFRIKLIEGMRERGLSPEFAEQVFQQIRGFGEYGFPESHAASFALLVYVSAWIKYYYPAVFTAALLNSQPMGFYAPAQLIRDARDHGVEVRPVDVNYSDWDCTLEPALPATSKPPAPLRTGAPPFPFALRLGFRLLHGFPQAAAERICEVRGRGFTGMEELARRTGLPPAQLARLAEADALASLGRDRRSALWEAMAQLPDQDRKLPLFAGLPAEDEPEVELPPLPPDQEVYADYHATGFSLRDHPLRFYRDLLDQLDVRPARRLARTPNRTRVRVAGLVILRQRPSTAKGITFVTLEDETGIANLILKQQVWEQYYAIARRSAAWIATGKLERHDSVIHVVVDRLEDLGRQLQTLRTKSRDFR